MLICNEIALSFVTAMKPWMEFYTASETFALNAVELRPQDRSLLVFALSFSNARRDIRLVMYIFFLIKNDN